MTVALATQAGTIIVDAALFRTHYAFQFVFDLSDEYSHETTWSKFTTCSTFAHDAARDVSETTSVR